MTYRSNGNTTINTHIIMDNTPTAELAEPLLALIKSHQTQSDEPCFVALDGYSGSGKSTLADFVANSLPSAAVIEGDEFYTGGSFNSCSSRTTSENARRCINWRQQHAVLSALKSNGFATWRAFDWHSQDWDSDNIPYCTAASRCETADVVLLEGVYSTRTELSSLFDLRVMLDVPKPIREQQLIAREGDNIRSDFELLWANAEHYYFENQLDQQSLHLVLA